MMVFELDEKVDAFEAALVAGDAGPEDIVRFLPPADDENYGQVLIELLRITLEHKWQSGQTDALAPLLAQFPDIASNLSLIGPLAYEEYRLRASDGQSVDRSEYSRRFGINVSSWQKLTPAAAECNVHSNDAGDTAASWTEFSQSVPAAAAVLAVARRRLPSVGDEFGPFRLVALLGQGAFGTVFLARQTTLANRYVALKVTAGPTIEADRLARMQHSNIVPIYSVHRRSRLSGVCMPYLGSITLADLIAKLRLEARLPPSAQSLAETVAARQLELSTVMGPEQPPAQELHESRPTARAEQALTRLAARPLEEAICWIIARVAAGLAHAHERGIVHRDIKPANILISDDGEPLILDFNLATDRSPAVGHLARLGGTLPYMAPEQFESFQGGPAEVTAASDVFSLGVVLYESLTRLHPFPVHRGSLDEVVAAMLRDRRELTPKSIRQLNSAVSPGLASIVGKCLEPNPTRRYRDANELHEDLQRHLDHRPLRHARERSVIEVAQKWRRRHPRLSSATSVTLVAMLFGAVAGGIWMTREHHHANRGAEEDFRAFHATVPAARTLLIVSNPASSEEREGISAAKDVLARYHVLDNPRWHSQPSVQLLGQASQVELVADVVDLNDLLARRDPSGSAKDSPSDGPWIADGAGAIERRREATDRLVMLHAQKGQGPGEAAKQLDEMTRSRPTDVAGWIILGDCRRMAGDLAGAEAACTAAIALRSDLYMTWYWRGIVRLEGRRARDAEADFNDALARRPIFPSGWANRGIARYEQGNYIAAIDDLTTAIDHGLEDPLVYFRRARCYEALKQDDAAKRDREIGARFQVRDAQMLYERGMAHIRIEKYEAAEQDFSEAIKLAPQFMAALRNLAHVQSELLQKTEQGIATLDRILGLKADDLSARVSRGVLYGRLGKKHEALEDAQAVIDRKPPPLELYQAACVFALLGKDDAELRSSALGHLEQSLARLPSLATTARTDPDMANLRDEQRFIQLTAQSSGKISAASTNGTPTTQLKSPE